VKTAADDTCVRSLEIIEYLVHGIDKPCQLNATGKIRVFDLRREVDQFSLDSEIVEFDNKGSPSRLDIGLGLRPSIYCFKSKFNRLSSSSDSPSLGLL
jgi:hypothetical protein